MEFKKEDVEKARAICMYVLPEQIVQGTYPNEVCLTNSVNPGQPITGKVIEVRCYIKLGFRDEKCVFQNPTSWCRVSGATETQVKTLGSSFQS
jgi:hypothetical protein